MENRPAHHVSETSTEMAATSSTSTRSSRTRRGPTRSKVSYTLILLGLTALWINTTPAHGFRRGNLEDTRPWAKLNKTLTNSTTSWEELLPEIVEVLQNHTRINSTLAQGFQKGNPKATRPWAKLNRTLTNSTTSWDRLLPEVVEVSQNHTRMNMTLPQCGKSFCCNYPESCKELFKYLRIFPILAGVALFGLCFFKIWESSILEQKKSAEKEHNLDLASTPSSVSTIVEEPESLREYSIDLLEESSQKPTSLVGGKLKPVITVNF